MSAPAADAPSEHAVRETAGGGDEGADGEHRADGPLGDHHMVAVDREEGRDRARKRDAHQQITETDDENVPLAENVPHAAEERPGTRRRMAMFARLAQDAGVLARALGDSVRYDAVGHTLEIERPPLEPVATMSPYVTSGWMEWMATLAPRPARRLRSTRSAPTL